MSLINDALKRASDKPAANPDLPKAVPITRTASNQSGGSGIKVLGVILLIAAVGAVVWFRQRKAPEQVQAPVTAKAAAPSTPVASNPVQRAANILAKVTEHNQDGTEAPPATVTAVTTPVSVPAPVAQAPKPVEVARAVVQPKAEPSKGSFPPLKLQAIYYRQTNPTVIVNGKTVAQGEAVNGAKIVTIHRNSVEFEFEGASQTLSMK